MFCDDVVRDIAKITTGSLMSERKLDDRKKHLKCTQCGQCIHGMYVTATIYKTYFHSTILVKKKHGPTSPHADLDFLLLLLFPANPQTLKELSLRLTNWPH